MVDQTNQEVKVQFHEDDIGKEAVLDKINETSHKICDLILEALNLPKDNTGNQILDNPPLLMPHAAAAVVTTAAGNLLAYIQFLRQSDDAPQHMAGLYGGDVYQQFVLAYRQYEEQFGMKEGQKIAAPTSETIQ